MNFYSSHRSPMQKQKQRGFSTMKSIPCKKIAIGIRKIAWLERYAQKCRSCSYPTNIYGCWRESTGEMYQRISSRKIAFAPKAEVITARISSIFSGEREERFSWSGISSYPLSLNFSLVDDRSGLGRIVGDEYAPTKRCPGLFSISLQSLCANR